MKAILRLGSQAINLIRGKCLNTQRVGALSKWPVHTVRLAFGSAVIRRKDGRARTDLETELYDKSSIRMCLCYSAVCDSISRLLVLRLAANSGAGRVSGGEVLVLCKIAYL